MVADNKKNSNVEYLLIACFMACIILQFFLPSSFESSKYINVPLHAVLEATGTILALLIAYCLLSLKKLNRGPSRSDRIACALIGMGLLDGFHAVSDAGNIFVWLHSIAVFVGGLFFVLVILPDNIYSKLKKTWPLLSVLIAVVAGAYSFLAPQNIPKMLFEDSFSLTAILLNIIGGILFYLTAIYFLFKWRKDKNTDSVLFAIFCLLIGTSAIMFQQSKFWNVYWWAWHFVKVIAYMSILRFVFLLQARIIIDIIDGKKKLEVLSSDLEIGLAKMTESEKKYHSLVEHAGDPIFLLDFDTFFNEVNSSSCKILGYSQTELLQMNISDVFIPGETERLPLQLETVNINKALISERRVIRKDGTEVDVEINVRLLEGKGYLCIARDITERKRIEGTLRESERKYRNIFENVQDVFYQTSLEGITLNVSPSVKQHLGFTPEEVIGTPVANIYYDPEDREKGLKILKEKGELKDYEMRFKSKSGELVYVSLNTLLITDEHGNPSHLDGSYKNITDRKKAEFELEATLLQLENRVIERTKELSDKNKDILDSITYAKRIQEAKLPKKEEIYSSLPHSFVLFKPKDIVSGDFYFFHKNNNQTIFLAAADCTGHGVPGALMSMLGSEKLNDAVAQSTDPSKILNLLNKGIKTSLRQSSKIESTRDGMDIALCHVDIEHRVIKFAGANRPFWIIRKNKSEVEELKSTKKALGGLTDDYQSFQSHEIQLQKGDTFYLTTDGFADTFGGPFKKKLMTKKFKQILLDIQNKEMSEQEKYLDDFIESWKSGIEQVDDILVIGVRL